MWPSVRSRVDTPTVSSSVCVGEAVTVSHARSGQLGGFRLALAERQDLEARYGRHADQDVRRAVLVEALDRLHAPVLAARALGLRPRDRLEVRVVDEVAARRHLDPVPARLEAVEEEALRHAVLRGRRLDRHVGVDEDVGRAQAFLARVDPERQVVETAARAVRVRDVDQLVGRDREAHPGAALRPVVHLDPLVEPIAEHVLREDAVGADVRGEHVHVVEPLHRTAATDVALRLIPPRRPQVLRRLVALGVVEELEDVAVGVREAVGAAMADVAVDPPLPEPRLLDRGDAPLERLGAPGAQGDVADARLRAPPSARGCSGGSRPSRAGRRTGPSRASSSMPSTSTKKRRLSSGFGVRSSACAMRATSCIGSVIARPAPAGRRGRRTARPPGASPASRAHARRARGPPPAPRRRAPAGRRRRRPRRARRRRPG